MANEKNLVPFRSENEAREKGKKGGKKSGEARREKRLLKDLLEEALLIKTDTGNKYIDITNALIKQAEEGNVKAYETIRDTLGQKPVEKAEISGNIENSSTNLLLESINRQLCGGNNGTK